MAGMPSIKRDLRLMEWSKLIEQQHESGETIDEWCREQGKARNQYYYWQRKIREAAILSIAEPSDVQQIPQQGGLTTPPRFAQINLNRPAKAVCIGVSIRIMGIEIDIMNGADTDMAQRVISALVKSC